MENTRDIGHTWARLCSIPPARVSHQASLLLGRARTLPAHRREPHSQFLMAVYCYFLNASHAGFTRLMNTVLLDHPATVPNLHRPSMLLRGFSVGSYTAASMAIVLRGLAWNLSLQLGALACAPCILPFLIGLCHEEVTNPYLGELASRPHQVRVIRQAADKLCCWQPALIPSFLYAALSLTMIVGTPMWDKGSHRSYCHLVGQALPIGLHSLGSLLLRYPLRPPHIANEAALRLLSWMRLQMADTFKPLLQALGHSDDELLALANQLGQAKGLPAPLPSLADMGIFLLSHIRVGLTVHRDERKPEPLLKPADNIPWLVELARTELQKVSFRELIVLLYIFLPQLSYQAVHPSVESKADAFSMVGIVATTFPKGMMPAKLRPYALGPEDINEYYLDFHDNSDLPALFALPQVGARVLTDLPEADPERGNQRF
eukprot:Skav204642  [mRNA]  locus=scaffold1712:466315:467610:- [translate_table: standard]